MGASQLGKFEPTPRYRAPLPGGEIFEKSPPGRGRGGLSEVIAKVRCTLLDQPCLENFNGLQTWAFEQKTRPFSSP